MIKWCYTMIAPINLCPSLEFGGRRLLLRALRASVVNLHVKSFHWITDLLHRRRITMLLHKELSEKIIGCCIEVHRELGPGLLEGIYEAALGEELRMAGIAHQRQLPLPVVYKGIDLGMDYRIDVMVESEIVLELKSVEKSLPLHEAQLMTYLKLSRRKLGFLLNFNVPLMKEGITRRVM
jgi:GxxExxY protein